MNDELLVIRCQLGEREVVILYHLRDLSLDDSAAVCGVPAGTVKSRLSRARHLLRVHLETKGYTP